MATQTTLGSVTVRPQDRTATSDLRLPGFVFFVLGAAFITVTMLLASSAPGYDFNAAAISDLGLIDATAPWFNALLIGIGVLNIAGGYLYYRGHGRAWLLSLYVIAGIGAIGAGAFPLDTGGLHSIFAFVAFLFVNLEGLGTAAVVTGPMRILALVAATIGLVYTGVMVIGDSGNPAIFGPIGHGGSERMIAYPMMLWLIALGGYLMAGGTRGREPA